MADPFSVVPFSEIALRDALSSHDGASLAGISSSGHLDYLVEYLRALQTKVLIIERGYVDRDYLEDFAAYCVRCFHPYERRCSRLHFFARDFGSDWFRSVLREGAASNGVEDLKATYLGFVVVKPLPRTVVGRTCLKCYPEDDKKHREYPVKRRYDVNLFGISLSVESLAFQQQDSVAAACATSALWSVFHGTGLLFQHPIPSPATITEAASRNFPSEHRSFPNRGLNLAQMANAARSVGLEPEILRAEDPFVLRSTVAAYLRAGMPLLLGIHLVECDATGCGQINPDFRHAVAVTGYRSDPSAAVKPVPAGQTLFRAMQIDRLYAHDDGVGPFCRMSLDGKVSTIKDTDGKSFEMETLSTHWPAAPGHEMRAIPLQLLLPLYHKMRIPFRLIQNAIVAIDGLISNTVNAGLLTLTDRLLWDVKLVPITRLKADLFLDEALSGMERESMLTEPLPRYLWLATASDQGKMKIGLLFDATDIEQGCIFVRGLHYDEAFCDKLKAVTAGIGASISAVGSRLAETVLTSPRL